MCILSDFSTFLCLLWRVQARLSLGLVSSDFPPDQSLATLCWAPVLPGRHHVSHQEAHEAGLPLSSLHADLQVILNHKHIPFPNTVRKQTFSPSCNFYQEECCAIGIYYKSHINFTFSDSYIKKGIRSN